MRICPLDIQQKEFPITFRGFKVSEVHDFLNIVREEMEDLLHEIEHLREELKGHKNLEAQLWNFIEQHIKNKVKDDEK
ncbi:MAG: DivIVA domain-containing protein [Nitrospirae bacterium]|nr:DivIVA domain-containing protein [Nitrospirota bacterium]